MLEKKEGQENLIALYSQKHGITQADTSKKLVNYRDKSITEPVSNNKYAYIIHISNDTEAEAVKLTYTLMEKEKPITDEILKEYFKVLKFCLQSRNNDPDSWHIQFNILKDNLEGESVKDLKKVVNDYATGAYGKWMPLPCELIPAVQEERVTRLRGILRLKKSYEIYQNNKSTKEERLEPDKEKEKAGKSIMENLLQKNRNIIQDSLTPAQLAERKNKMIKGEL